MKMIGKCATAAAIMILPALTLAESQEKQIQRSDLPDAVRKTVDEQTKGAKIRGLSTENENGQTYYEVELIVSGHRKDVLIDSHGSVVEVEEQVSLDSLPQAVRDGLQAKTGNGKVVKVESLTKRDRLVAYEAEVLTDGKRSEIQVGPDGAPLNHEE
jgi:uncharacterized membrane protein YkoI